MTSRALALDCVAATDSRTAATSGHDDTAHPPPSTGRAAAGVEHGEPADIAGERPRHGVGVQPPVSVAVGADLHLPGLRVVEGPDHRQEVVSDDTEAD